MKTKVPEVGVVVDVSPVADPRKKRIHLYQLRGLGRELRGICVCDHQADVVADDARLRDAEGASEGVNANRALATHLQVPTDATPGQTIQLVLEATDHGTPPL